MFNNHLTVSLDVLSLKKEYRLHVYYMDGGQISVFLHPFLLLHIKRKVITIQD